MSPLILLYIKSPGLKTLILDIPLVIPTIVKLIGLHDSLLDVIIASLSVLPPNIFNDIDDSKYNLGDDLKIVIGFCSFLLT